MMVCICVCCIISISFSGIAILLELGGFDDPCVRCPEGEVNGYW